METDVGAVGRSSVDRVPILSEFLNTKGFVKRDRVAGGASFVKRSHNGQGAERMGGIGEKLKSLSGNTIVVAEEDLHEGWVLFLWWVGGKKRNGRGERI